MIIIAYLFCNFMDDKKSTVCTERALTYLLIPPQTVQTTPSPPSIPFRKKRSRIEESFSYRGVSVLLRISFLRSA